MGRVRALFVGRGWSDTLAWLVCLLISAGALARAAQTGRGRRAGRAETERPRQLV
jgi:hypothetical protein